ncbi:MAG: SAM-dependent chlorinase/fluorinase [Blastocatellia bacterium]|nr:SAM-dependent chlorinase/fluorinase [Blastocatellia bacterium]MBL8192967.1 SAM-dependent chlorinase/fluorinase [Blastocatellia bacterium]MBN8725327.1 SAM-dependent chlorinase/fluorinase [Acidobacteriota bacterium]
MKKLILSIFATFFILFNLLVSPSLMTFASSYQTSKRTPKTQQTNSPTILFMSDFGVIDDSVAICKGVMLSIEPKLKIIDISHQVTPYSILDGARFLAGTTAYYPPATVFAVVIDPGVGSERKAIVAKSKRGQYFVLPNNGLLTLVEQQDGLEAVREITNTKLMIGQALSSTFHGRDIFSPVAAHIAKGENWAKVGPILPINELVKLNISAAQIDEKGLSAEVIGLDGPYGNLVTNVDAEVFYKLGYKISEKINIKIGEQNISLPFVKTFSDVAVNQPLLYIDSRGHLALAINQNNFAQVYKVQPPVKIYISARK